MGGREQGQGGTGGDRGGAAMGSKRWEAWRLHAFAGVLVIDDLNFDRGMLQLRGSNLVPI